MPIWAQKNGKCLERFPHFVAEKCFWISFHILLSCNDCFELFSVSYTKEKCFFREISSGVYNDYENIWKYQRFYWIFIVNENDIWNSLVVSETSMKIRKRRWMPLNIRVIEIRVVFIGKLPSTKRQCVRYHDGILCLYQKCRKQVLIYQNSLISKIETENYWLWNHAPN